MAAAVSKGADNVIRGDAVKLFLRDLKQAVRKENESPTKIRSFNRLLRRVPGTPCYINRSLLTCSLSDVIKVN